MTKLIDHVEENQGLDGRILLITRNGEEHVLHVLVENQIKIGQKKVPM